MFLNAFFTPAFCDFCQTQIGSSYERTDTNPVLNGPVYLLVDVETTGLSTSSYITQIAAKVLGDNENFSRYILPPVRLSPKIEELTGITNIFLNYGGFDPVTGINHKGPAGDFSQAFKDFSEFVSRKAQDRPVCLVAHNAAFDLRMLNAEIKRLAIQARRDANNCQIAPSLKSAGIVTSLDSLGMFKSRKVWPLQSKNSMPRSFGLGNIYVHVHQKKKESMHNAVNDVEALEEILLSPMLEGWQSIARDLQLPIISLPA